MKLWSRVPLFNFASIYVNFRSFAIRSSNYLGSFSSRCLLGFCEMQKASIVCGLEPYMFVTCFWTSVWFVSPHNSICSPDYCLPLRVMFLNELCEFCVSRTETEYIYVHLYCFQSYFFNLLGHVNVVRMFSVHCTLLQIFII